MLYHRVVMLYDISNFRGSLYGAATKADAFLLIIFSRSSWQYAIARSVTYSLSQLKPVPSLLSRPTSGASIRSTLLLASPLLLPVTQDNSHSCYWQSPLNTPISRSFCPCPLSLLFCSSRSLRCHLSCDQQMSPFSRSSSCFPPAAWGTIRGNALQRTHEEVFKCVSNRAQYGLPFPLGLGMGQPVETLSDKPNRLTFIHTSWKRWPGFWFHASRDANANRWGHCRKHCGCTWKLLWWVLVYHVNFAGPIYGLGSFKIR